MLSEMQAPCDEFRQKIKDLGEEVLRLKHAPGFLEKASYPNQHSEMLANIMLTYRHLEDARMRLGKVLQAADDGVSIFDK